MLRLTGSAVDSVGDFSTDSCRGARDGIFAIEALDEEEDAKGDEDDTDNIFHGWSWSTLTTDPLWGFTFLVSSSSAGGNSTNDLEVEFLVSGLVVNVCCFCRCRAVARSRVNLEVLAARLQPVVVNGVSVALDDTSA